MSNSTYTGSFGSIYVPASLVDAYKSATNWATYASRITAIVEEDNGNEDPASLILFTIDDTTYQAEEGMTWTDWCNSAYNIGPFTADGLVYTPNGACIVGTAVQTPVATTDLIIANQNYITYVVGSGGFD